MPHLASCAAGTRLGSGRRLKRRSSGRSSCDEAEMGAAAAAAGAAGALGEPSSASAHSACEAKPGDEAGRLRQLLVSQKAGYEVRCLRYTLALLSVAPAVLCPLHVRAQRRPSTTAEWRIRPPAARLQGCWWELRRSHLLSVRSVFPSRFAGVEPMLRVQSSSDLVFAGFC